MKLSEYYVLVPHDDATAVLFSTFNNALVSLDQEEYSYFELIQRVASCKRYFEESDCAVLMAPDLMIQQSFSETFETLEKLGFLIADDVSEKAIVDFERTRSMLHGVPAFSVMTTTGCNARCPYCFEKGYVPQSMSETTANSVADYILTHVSKGEVYDLEWFGGEPLVNVHPIDVITARLKEAGILQYGRISMASNGILFDEDIIRRAAENWNLGHVQITLDGTRERHDEIKLGAGKTGAFDKVVNNILNLASQGVYASIRVNVSPENEPDIMNMLDELAPIMGGNPNIGFYAYPLFSPVHAESRETVRRIIRITEHIVELDLRSASSSYQLYALQSRCLATNYRGATIAPDGNIYECSHCLDERSYLGDIWHDDPYNPKKIAWSNPLLPQECSDCVILPLCQGGCKVAEVGYEKLPQCSLWKNGIEDVIVSLEKMMNSASGR